MSDRPDDVMHAQARALIDLLDDHDHEVRSVLVARLESDATLLDQAWLAAEMRRIERNAPPPQRLVEAVLRADAEALVDAYAQADDVETGAWLLARLHAPRFDHRAHGAPQIDGLAAQVRALIAAGADPDARTVAVHLGHACGFSGDRDTYDDPQNSFLPCVLERRLGLPITLTVLWLAISRRLELPADAIALPGHVLGRWRSADDDGAAHGYLDLFNRGAPVTKHELDLRARLAGEASAQPYLAAASDRALLRRMARNLALSYVRRGDQLRATIAHGMATA